MSTASSTTARRLARVGSGWWGLACMASRRGAGSALLRGAVGGLDADHVSVDLEVLVALAGGAGLLHGEGDLDQPRRADRGDAVGPGRGGVPGVHPIRTVEVAEAQALYFGGDDGGGLLLAVGEVSAGQEVLAGGDEEFAAGQPASVGGQEVGDLAHVAGEGAVAALRGVGLGGHLAD